MPGDAWPTGPARCTAASVPAIVCARGCPLDGLRRCELSPQEIDAPVTVPELDLTEAPEGSDRRSFMMRSALATSIAALTGRPIAAFSKTPAKAPLNSPTL